MLKWLTAGESHGPALVAVLDGMPAGVQVTTSDVEQALARRRAGYGRGARMKFEQDQVRIIGGVRHGQTMGSPIAIEIANTEWPKWEQVMSPDPVNAVAMAIDAGVGDPLEVARNRPLTRPRPGHADLAAMQKYGFADARPALERASARETAARVALGAIAANFLRQVAGIEVVGQVVAIGSVNAADWSASQRSDGRTPDWSVEQGRSPDRRNHQSETLQLPTPTDREYLDADPVRCLNSEASAAMVAEIDAAKKDGDTLGGVIEVLAYHVPPGLGSYSQGDTRLDAQLAAALMGIQAVKGVEIGDGFAAAARRGSAAHDEIFLETNGGSDGRDLSVAAQPTREVIRLTNRAGGIEGGMSNGSPIRVRAAIKPISSVPRALRTIDVATGEAATAHHQRSDVCAVVPAVVVAEAEVALVLARALLEKFGGDSVPETRRNIDGYLTGLAVPWFRDASVPDAPQPTEGSVRPTEDHAGLTDKASQPIGIGGDDELTAKPRGTDVCAPH